MNSSGNDLQAVYDIVKEGRGQPEVILQRLIETIKQRPLPVAGLPTVKIPPKVDVPQLLSSNAAFKDPGLYSQKRKLGGSENILFPGWIPPSNLPPKFSPSFPSPKNFFPYTRPPPTTPSFNARKQYPRGFVPFSSSQHDPQNTNTTLPTQPQPQPPKNFLQQQIQDRKYCEFSWFISHPYYIAKYQAPKRSRSKKRGIKKQSARNIVLNKRQRIKPCEGLEKLAEIAIAELQGADLQGADACQEVHKEISLAGQQDLAKQGNKDDVLGKQNFEFNHQLGNFEEQMKILQKMKNVFNLDQLGANFSCKNININNIEKQHPSYTPTPEQSNDNQKYANFQQNNQVEHTPKNKTNINNINKVLINEAIKDLLDFSKNSEDLKQLENQAEKLVGTQAELNLRSQNLTQQYDNLNDQMQQMNGQMETKLANLEFELIESNKQLMQILQKQSMSQSQRKQTIEWLQNMLTSIANKQQTC